MNLSKKYNDYPEVRFLEIHILRDELPAADPWLRRDVLFHFPNSSIITALERFTRSEFEYLLTSHFENVSEHRDIRFGLYRPVNLTKPPFNWPAPYAMLFDGDDADPDRYLGIWRKQDIVKV